MKATLSTQVSIMLDAYLEVMRLTDGGPDRPDFNAARLSPDAEATARQDCQRFFDLAKPLLERSVHIWGYDWIDAGIDFWLTRNGHGSGFWDQKCLAHNDLGQKLSQIAHEMGPSESYLGDGGRIYLTSSMTQEAP